MPPFSSDGPLSIASASPNSSVEGLSRKSNERTVSGVFTITNGGPPDARSQDYPKKENSKPYKASTLYSLPNGVASGVSKNGWEDAHSKIGSTTSIGGGPSQSVEQSLEQSRPLHGGVNGTSKLSVVETLEDGQADGVLAEPMHAHEQTTYQIDGEQTSPVSPVSHQKGAFGEDGQRSEPHDEDLLAAGHKQHVPPLNRFSSPAGMSPNVASSKLTPNHVSSTHPPLTHRHTLQVPKATNTGRTSRDFSFTGGPSEEALSTGRFSPTHGEHPHRRRGSLGLVRRTTRSMQSDAHLDEIPQDEDALRWTEAIRQKRASKRKRREEEDDDRVIVGTKVDQGHVNWVTAYNMLTGIRFTVSRTNAKIDRALTDSDFTARHKFSFDVTGNELTPSAKYDFKFKDYAPWVFRRLRAHFGLDPADYLMSLTSKYILSELGSPGKSGSFFYFSRDYKYIIKTIHHAEHKLLRKILKDYYNHVVDNPNTLISQFYGLHRVKIPYGRKIHFVIMNNLFPPHRDIHQMFDLKGSTVGRDFKEEDLESNPRATLKDLNWLRRDLHLEFNHNMKEIFVEQVRRDVSLLQKLHIMDYSLLVGVHDLGKGNDENLREATLKVYQPGGERETEDSMGSNMLTRTPSKMENARNARQLRLTLKKEKPVPMGLVQAKMPDELLDDERTNQVFYSNDGGVRASHENGEPGEKIYYLGIIDCLTHYGFVKRLEHFWKGLSADSSQISPVPSEGYGNRFIKFMTGITMTNEEAARRAAEEGNPTSEADAGIRAQTLGASFDGARSSKDSRDLQPKSPLGPVDKTMAKAHRQADKSEKHRRRSGEDEPPNRTLGTTESASADRTHGTISATLPIVEEVGEAGSTGGRSGRSGNSRRSPVGDDADRSRARSNVRSSTGGIRQIQPSGEHTATDDEKVVGPYKSFLPDVPKLAPLLSCSPGQIDPEKNYLDTADRGAVSHTY